MLPLSFKEYHSAFPENTKSNMDLFNDYIKLGSFPYLSQINEDEGVAKAYIEGISDVLLLENIIKMLITTIGSPISAKKITDTLIS